MNYGLKEVMDVILWDLITGKPVIYFDSLKMSDIESAAEQVHASGGKYNPRRVTWDHSQTATVTMQDALISMKSLALLHGANDAVKGSVIVPRVEDIDPTLAVGATPGTSPTGGKITVTTSPTSNGDLTITLGTEAPITVAVLSTDSASDTAAKITSAINAVANTKFTATQNVAAVELTTTNVGVTITVAAVAGTTGAVMATVNFTGGTAANPGTLIHNLKETPTVNTAVFLRNGITGDITPIDVANIAGKAVTISGPPASGELIYQFTTTATAETVELRTDRFPGYYRMTGTTWFRSEETGKDELVTITVPKCKMQPGHKLGMSAEGEPSVFDFKMDIQKQGKNRKLYSLSKYEGDIE